jgi:amino acid adenylation domain-containing protein
MLTDAQREALKAWLRRGRAATLAGIPRRAPGRTDLPLSYGQEQLWFLDRFAPGLAAYNIPNALELSGPLDVAALGRALDALAARHEALRTRLTPSADGHQVQMISPPEPVPVEPVDISALAADKRQARLREIIDTAAMRPFSLAEGPLLRAWLIQLADREHVLLLVVHHAVFDGWSAGLLTRELAALYGQEAAGVPAGLAELPVQFADYALWERDRLAGGTLAELQEYWRQALQGFQTIQFPADRPRPLVDSFEGARVQRTTDPGLLRDLREISRQHGTTLFVTLLAGLYALLQRYTGQSDLVVGTVSANRTRPELAALIGFLVNTLPVRCDLSGDPAFTELLARVREATTGAYAHQELPFGKLVETLQVKRDASRSPVYQVAFVFAERDVAPARGADVDFVLTDLAVGIDASKFDLDILAEARRDGLWLEATYTPALFDAGTVERLLANFETLLRGAAAGPSEPLSRLPVLTAAERHQELRGWNDTAARFPVECVHHGFEAQVARTPDAVAAEFEGDEASYARLDAEANRIARRLREAGVGPEVLVGVCMRASVRRLAALLGIWKAGGGYVPLDPGLPAGRLSFMVADTGMPVLLTDDASAGHVPPGISAAVMSIDAGLADGGQGDGGHAERAGDEAGLVDGGAIPANVAYVIYTSGSTGEPKGVVLEHRQVSNFLHGQIGYLRAGPQDRVLAFHSLSFDPSVQDMFLPLLCGARVVLASDQTLHSPPRLAALIRDRRLTLALLNPPVLSLLGHGPFPDLRVLSSGGEELPAELARRWLQHGIRCTNEYGPTETTVTAISMDMDSGTPMPPPIGRPMPNYQAYVLDAHLNPVPTGVIGELHIGGDSVARGYLNRPGLTARQFVADPFAARPGARLYKTGDLVRRRGDGTLVFLGRADGQVKIRGLRVELGEIEAALTAHPAVAQAAVTMVTDPAGDQQLAGYLRLHAGIEATAGELREHLASRLPGYLIPGYLIFVAEFPLTTSSKIDWSALPAPQPGSDAAAAVAPATLIETVLVNMYAVVLGHDRVGATDSFFDIGGSSLKVMRLITMLQDDLAVDIDVPTVFLAPTPRQLAGLLRDQHGLEDADLGADGLDGLVQLTEQSADPG